MNEKQQMLQFESLFRNYYKILRSYAYRFVNDKEIAEDIVQDVFFEVWKKRADLSLNDSLKGYLFKAVYNISINYLNSSSYLRSTSLNSVVEQDLINRFLKSQNQESLLFFKEIENEIESFIITLPEQCRKIFILSRKHEMKNKEIAEHLNISIKAVEKQITKALSGLRSHLQKRDLLFLLFLFKFFQ